MPRLVAQAALRPIPTLCASRAVIAVGRPPVLLASWRAVKMTPERYDGNGARTRKLEGRRGALGMAAGGPLIIDKQDRLAGELPGDEVAIVVRLT